MILLSSCFLLFLIITLRIQCHLVVTHTFTTMLYSQVKGCSHIFTDHYHWVIHLYSQVGVLFNITVDTGLTRALPCTGMSHIDEVLPYWVDKRGVSASWRLFNSYNITPSSFNDLKAPERICMSVSFDSSTFSYLSLTGSFAQFLSWESKHCRHSRIYSLYYTWFGRKPVWQNHFTKQ